VRREFSYSWYTWNSEGLLVILVFQYATSLSNSTAVNVVMCFVKFYDVCCYVLHFENVLNTGVLYVKQSSVYFRCHYMQLYRKGV
jgi:hypothetical protein